MNQYRVGRVTFASVLEAIAGVIDDEDGYLQTVAAAQRVAIAAAEVSLDAAGGGAGTLSTGAVPGRRAASGGGALAAAGAPPRAAATPAHPSSMSKM